MGLMSKNVSLLRNTLNTSSVYLVCVSSVVGLLPGRFGNDLLPRLYLCVVDELFPSSINRTFLRIMVNIFEYFIM